MIDRQQVHHVAFLARLDLTPAEEEQFTQQLDTILSYVEQLKELNTDEIEPTFHAVTMDQVLRDDQVQTWGDIEGILASAPEREEQFFRVPKILGSS